MKTLTTALINFILLFSVITGSFAQELRKFTGRVTDNNGKPVAGVTVTPRGMDVSVATDENGYYEISAVPDSIKTLTFTHPSMETVTASIGFYETIDVRMIKLGSEDIVEISLEDLLNIEVTTVSKSSEKISDAPGVISVLTQDDIRRFGGNTLKDLLERIPGLIGSTVYMTDRSTIAPRGDQILASSSHVLLLLNGRPVREALEGGIKAEMYQAFPVNIIERIEVIRGPGSVLYGSNACSAVINVITEKAEGDKITISGKGGLPGDFGGQGEIRFDKGDFGLVLAGQYLKRENWETDWQYADPTSATGETTLNISMPDEALGSYLGANYKNLRLMASYNQWDNYYLIPDYAFIFPAHGIANWKKGFVNLGYSLKAAKKWNMDFNATYTRSTFKTQSWPNTNRDSYEMVGEWTNFYNPTEKLGLVFGGLFNFFDGQEWGFTETSEKIVYTDANRYSTGAYAQFNYRLFTMLNLIGGIQVNKVEGIDLNVVPRAGFIWYPAERINIKAFYAEAFRAPSINEFSINFPQMLGNPDLTPEKVNTVDIAAGYQGEQISLGINFFYSQMKNIIFQNRDTNVVPAPMYWNGGEVDFIGLELEGKYYLTKELYAVASVLYQSNEDLDGNKDVTPLSSLGIKAGLSYAAKNGITASVFNIYQGKLGENYDTELNPSPGAYDLLNMYLNFDLVNLLNLDLRQGISCFIQADNLLNQEIWLPAWGLTLGTSIPKNRGMSLYAGFEVSF
ncbi:MAG: TonB-dependent receptor [Bacteroidales bacterium]|nr:TonB-dependent receptor [Bacteroidales bacterium]